MKKYILFLLIVCVSITVSAQVAPFIRGCSLATRSTAKITAEKIVKGSIIRTNPILQGGRQIGNIGGGIMLSGGITGMSQISRIQWKPGNTGGEIISYKGLLVGERLVKEHKKDNTLPLVFEIQNILPAESFINVGDGVSDKIEKAKSSEWKEKLRERVKNKIHKINTIQTKGNLYMIYGYIFNLKDNGENFSYWAA